MSEADRRALAEQQGALVRTLCGAAAVPVGMNEERVRGAARSLYLKRLRGVEKTWPVLREELGDGFGEAFARYARERSLPRCGAGEDGGAFAEWLMRAGMLGDRGRRQLLLWRVRRGWPVGVMRLRGARRVVVALRLGRVWSMEFPARGSGPSL